MGHRRAADASNRSASALTSPGDVAIAARLAGYAADVLDRQRSRILVWQSPIVTRSIAAMELDQVIVGGGVRVLRPDGEPLRDKTTDDQLTGTIASINGRLVEIRLENRGSEGIIRCVAGKTRGDGDVTRRGQRGG